MKILNRCNDCAVTFFEEVMERLNKDKRERIRSAIPIIKIRFKEFGENINELENIKTSIALDKETQSDLKSMYSFNEKSLVGKNLKSKILDSQSMPFNILCPSCMYNSVQSFDHYLPKEEFPEFSIFFDNLVPSCTTCNSKRGDRWIGSNKKRTSLYFYLDSFIESVSVFDVRIFTDDDIWGIEFSCKSFDMVSEVISLEQYELLMSHIKKLELVKLYDEVGLRTLDSIQKEFSAVDSIEFEEFFYKLLTTKLNNFEHKYGVNYYEGVIYRNIIHNHLLKYSTSG